MKIIALADTHSRPLPKALLDDMASADLLVHAGDFADAEVYRHLKAIKDIRAVYGNMDGMDLRSFLPQQTVFNCEGVKIGLAHGEGAPEGIMARLQKEFEGSGVGVIIFGHSHTPYNSVVNGILFFNPGSPTDTVRSPYLSYGVLDVKDGKVKARIVKLK
jgi:putative phosphoesterase